MNERQSETMITTMLRIEEHLNELRFLFMEFMTDLRSGAIKIGSAQVVDSSNEER